MAINFSQVKNIQINLFNQLEYLHFNGTDNYLRTGISIYNSCEIEFSVDSFRCTVLGNSTFWIQVTSEGVLRAYNYITDPLYPDIVLDIASISTNTKYRLVIRYTHGVSLRCTLYQGDTEIANVVSFDMVNTDLSNLYAFSTSSQNSYAGKLYSLKAYGTDEYVPYQNTSTGEVGLYTDNNNLIKNMGGTINTTSSGPTVTPTVEFPSLNVKKIENPNRDIIWGSQDAFPYRVLEYIDIPANAYINTNNQGNSDVGVKLDINFNPDGESAQLSNQHLFGALYYNGSTYYRYHMTSSGNDGVQVFFGTGNSSYKNTGVDSTNNSRHYIEINSHSVKDNKLYVDNVDKGTYTTPSTTDTGNILLGARRYNNNGTVTVSNYPRKIRVYYLEVTGSNIGTNPNDTSKFYPCQRKSDGKIGLMKVFSDGQATRFCTSETSTELVAGPVVKEYWSGSEWLS